MKNIQKIILSVLVLIIVLSFLGCSLFSRDDEQPFPANEQQFPADQKGAVIVRHGSYIYKLGGLNADGIASDKTYVASLSVTPLEWTQTTSLPQARAFGIAFPAGNMMYYLGGTDGEVNTDTIYYTYLNPDDGTLGFPAAVKFWESNPISLPTAISHAGSVLYDGRIFLLGGITDEGVTDTIYQARIHANALMGQWYQSPQSLRDELCDVSAAVSYDYETGNRLITAGGTDNSYRVSNKITSYPLGDSGFLDTPEVLSDLPEPLTSAALIADGNELIVFGGYDRNLEKNSTVYSYSDIANSWGQLINCSAPVEGPSIVRIEGHLWYLAKEGEPCDEQGVISLALDSLASESPNIFPGSGFVSKNSSILTRTEPEVTLKYRLKGESVWEDIPDSLRITENAAYEFYTDSDQDSEIISRTYKVNSLGFIFSISGTIPIQEAGSDLQTVYLNSSITDSTAEKLTLVWAKLRLTSNEDLTLYWEDRTNSENPAYTGSIRLSLFEDDFTTEAIDVNGQAFLSRIASEGPINLSLQKGTYYILLEDTEETAGSSLGMAVNRK